MARSSSGQSSAAEPEKFDDGADTAVAPDRSLWDGVRVDPVEIALPGGVGFTLRAYRPAGDVTGTDVSERADEALFSAKEQRRQSDAADQEIVILDPQFAEEVEEERDDAGRRRGGRRGAEAADSDHDGTDDEDEDDEDEDDDEDEADDEEVPVFLSHRGRLLLFKSSESLVSFVRSGAPHDLSQLDTWAELAERIEPADVAVAEDDTYELDLVVDNLRGGHDAWDVDLLISAGELARDLSFALRLEQPLSALAPGSPLDNLDEALRSAARGGVTGMFARRRLRKIGTQQASLGWRTIIGKISAAVDWRD